MDKSNQIPPFPAFPCSSRYVQHASVGDAMERVQRSVASKDGISLVMGPPGTGKSLICNLLIQEFSETHDVVVVGDTTIQDAQGFHRHLLHHLDVEVSADADLYLALVDRVCGSESADRGMLMVIDEAQKLSAEVLEAVRMTTNIMRDGEPRVSAVVCGGVKLEDTLTLPALESFVQRVSTRCYLHPLNASETRHYIREAIRNCGSNPDQTITDEALGAVHHACSGVPRLINQLMTEAIDCAADADQDHICEKMIDQAWARLQQLPSPMVEEPKMAHQSSPVEFGLLSDTEDDFQSQKPQAMEAVEIPSPVQPIETPMAEPEPVAAFEPDPVPMPVEDFDPEPDFQDARAEQGEASFDFSQTETVIPHVAQNSIGYTEIEVSLGGYDFDEPTEPAGQPVAEMEPASAEWEAEPQEDVQDDIDFRTLKDIPESAPLPRILFGEFEHEETVPVTQAVTPSRKQEAEGIEREQNIHEELLELSDMANKALFADRPIVGPKARTRDVIWADEKRDHIAPLNNMVEPIRVRDDSDMLMIEDTLDLAAPSQPAQTVEPVAAAEPETLQVDYRAMLQRMREQAS